MKSSIAVARGQRVPKIMSLVLLTLLYLGLCIGQGTRAQKGCLPPPVLTAQPGPMVPSKKSVTILCQGPPEAKEYLLYKVSEPKHTEKKKSLMSGKTNTVTIEEMKPDQTGLYSCSYGNGEHWSQLSDPLRLVMTGAYEKPSLSSLSDPVVAPGDSVKVQCFSTFKFPEFILTKEDPPHPTLNQSSTPQENGHQAIFPMDHVTPTQAGTYRCYGAFSEDPYVWSQPSGPLQLVVRGEEAHSFLCPTVMALLVQASWPWALRIVL
ncbi:leukocyte immunoglobulin-like receptor subfamily B member 4 [Rhynchonycteris naso]